MNQVMPVFCEVFFANAFALWSSAVIASKLVLIHHCGKITKGENDPSKLSEFLKNFELLETQVITPLNQVFYEEYETAWMKETMVQIEWNEEDEDSLSEEVDGNTNSLNSYESMEWEKMKNKISHMNMGPIDPFHHYAKCLIVLNRYIYQAWSSTVLGPKTVAKIKTWIGYMKLVMSRKHKSFEHFHPSQQQNLLHQLHRLSTKAEDWDSNPRLDGDEYAFFSPGVLLIRAISSVYTGQDRTNFHHPKRDIWTNTSAPLIFQVLLKEHDPSRFINNTNGQTAYEFPFLGKLPIHFSSNEEIMKKEHCYMENVVEATMNYFMVMVAQLKAHPNTLNRSENVVAEIDIVRRITDGGMFSRTFANTQIRKMRNYKKAKTSKSEIKKVDKCRTRAYKPRFPVDALKKNKYIFGNEIVQAFINMTENRNSASSANKSTCQVFPPPGYLPEDCL